MVTPVNNTGMPQDTEDELDELLNESEKANLPLKNKVGAAIEQALEKLPALPHGKKLGIIAGSILFLILVYIAYIFLAPSFMADGVRDAPLENPETGVEDAAAENADGFLAKVESLRNRSQNNQQLQDRIRRLGSFEFLLVVTSEHDGEQVKVWSALITVENGRITTVQRNATKQDAECIGWMTAEKAAEIELTAQQLAQQIVRGNVKIAPRRCSTDIARKAADMVINQ